MANARAVVHTTGARHHRVAAPRHHGATTRRHGSHVLQAIDLTNHSDVQRAELLPLTTLSRSTTAARESAPFDEMGLIQSYDAPSNTALVQLAGATPNTLGPIALSKGLNPALAVAGAHCLVALLDAANPSDGSIIAIW